MRKRTKDAAKNAGERSRAETSQTCTLRVRVQEAGVRHQTSDRAIVRLQACKTGEDCQEPQTCSTRKTLWFINLSCHKHATVSGLLDGMRASRVDGSRRLGEGGRWELRGVLSGLDATG